MTDQVLLQDRVIREISRTGEGVCFPSAETFTRASKRIPPFSITAVGNEVSIVFDADLEFFSSGGSSRTSLARINVWTMSRLRTFVHDFTFMFLNPNTDQDLDRFLPTLGIKETPDWVFRERETLNVLEFTTRNTTRHASLVKAFSLKRSTYLDNLRSRFDLLSQGSGVSNINYYVVAVGQISVLMNMNLSQDLSQDLTDELCWRFNIANAIMSELDAQGIYKLPPDEMSESVAVSRSVLESVRFDWKHTEEHFSPFSEDMYNKWMDPLTSEDEDYIKRVVSKCVRESKRDIARNHYLDTPDLREEKNAEEYELKKTKYLDSFPRLVRPLYDTKAPIQLPFWIPSESETTDIYYRDIGEDLDPTFRLWRQAFGLVQEGKVEGLIHDEDRELKIIQGTLKLSDEEMKVHRGKYRRFQVDIEDEDRVELAKLGIEAKAMKEDPEVCLYRIQKKLPFSLESNVDDIENLFSDSDFYQPVDAAMNRDVFTAFRYASEIHGKEASKTILKIAKTVLSTRLGVFSTVVSDLASELSLSLKQHVKPRNFLIKKLRRFNLYLIVKPTESSKHLFFSLLMFKDDLVYLNQSTVFKSWKENDECMWTDFVSVNTSKLTNLIRCESTFLASSAHWMEFYSAAPWLPVSNEENMKSRRMVMLNMITLLNDKHTAEEIMTLQRYTFMELFVSYPCLPKPQKMFEKLPVILRSRFEVWLLKRAIENIRTVLGTKIEKEVIIDHIQWSSIPHPFFSETLDSPYHLINCFYLGYLKNKEETAYTNSIAAMFEKILKLEDQLPESDENLGHGDPEDPKKHEFSLSFLKYSVLCAKKHLSENMGGNPEKLIEDSILKQIAHEDLESFCTLKASSTFNESMFKSDPNREYHRIKVIEAMKPILDSSGQDVHLCVELVPDCLLEMRENKSLLIDLFRKPQHGGLREIYVLSVKARILQKTFEDMARAICKLFDSETMTNPNSKQNIPYSHNKRAKKTKMMTVSTSDDAALWNQGHFVTKFAAMMCLLTPEYMHPFIVQVSQLWMKKRIMIDPKLIKVMMDLRLDDSKTTLMRMARALRGASIEKWMKPGHGYIETKSGMMQGILHYTSSLWHTIFLVTYKDLVIKLMKNSDVLCIVNHLQSSDDSTVMISMPSSDPLKHLFLSATSFYLKERLGLYYGIYMSIKRTMNTLSMFEFNSEYHFGGNLYKPTFRWVAASLNVTEQESLASRQEEASNLIKDCLEGGSSYFTNNFIQLAQGLLHYRLMGSSVSPHFTKFREESSWSRDPGLGFFLLDNPFICGLAGFQYNLWKTCTSTQLGTKYRMLIEKQTATTDDKGKVKSLDVTMSGAFVGSTSVRYGDRKKWEKLINNFDPNHEDVYAECDIKPDFLYRRAENMEEIKKKLTLKLLNPGVIQSLSKGNALPRVIASSIYILSREVLSDSNSWFVKEEAPRQKTCILRELAWEKERYNGVGERLTEFQVRALFPFSSDFEQLESVTHSFDDIQGSVSKVYPRSVRTKIQMQESESRFLFSPDRLVAKYWFNLDKVRGARRVIEEQWRVLKLSFPWLSDDPSITLANSPFSNHVQMQNFFSRLDKSYRMIRLTGVPISSSGGSSSVFLSVVQGFFPGYRLETSSAKVNMSNSLKGAMHLIRMAFSYPLQDEAKEERIKDIIRKSDITFKPSSGGSRPNTLAILREALASEESWRSQKGNIQNLLRKIYFNKLGIIGHWTVVQPRDEESGEYRGLGVWSGRLDSASVRLQFLDKTLESITVSNIGIFRGCYHLLFNFLRDLGMEVTQKSNMFPSRLYYDGKSLNMTSQGCPIYEDQTHKDYYDPTQIRRLAIQVEINLRLVRIRAYYTGSERGYTVLSFSTRDKDINMSYKGCPILDSLDGVGLFERSWYTFESIPGKTGLAILMGESYPDRVDRAEFNNWSKNCAYNILAKRKMIYKVRAENLVENDFDIDELMDIEFDFDIDMEDFIGTEPAVGFEELEMDNSFLEYGIGDYNNIERDTTAFHPLWSETLDILIRFLSVDTVKIACCEGYLPQNQLSLKYKSVLERLFDTKITMREQTEDFVDLSQLKL